MVDKEKKKKWYLRNRDKQIERSKLWYENHKEEIKVKRKMRYDTDEEYREKAKAYSSEYRKKRIRENPKYRDELNQNHKEWIQKKRETDPYYGYKVSESVREKRLYCNDCSYCMQVLDLEGNKTRFCNLHNRVISNRIKYVPMWCEGEKYVAEREIDGT